MCNPRQLTIRASRELAEAWEAEISRTMSVTETLTGQATLELPFGQALPAAVRRRFEQLLAQDPGWQRREEGLRYDLSDGHLLYDVDTGVLEIVANVTRNVSADATAARTRQGVAEAAATVEVDVRYYDDGYAGLTKTAAERTGEAQATAKAQTEAEARLRERREGDLAAARAALAAMGDEVESEALAQARRKVENLRREHEAQLDHDAQQRAHAMRDTYLRVLNVPLAHAYRDVLLAQAEEADAQNMYVAEEDGFIHIQFEMEV